MGNLSENEICKLVRLSSLHEQLPQFVFHYTGIENVLKIIQGKSKKNEFRLTKIDGLSDKKEGKIILGEYRKALDNLYKNRIVSLEVKDFLKIDELPNQIVPKGSEAGHVVFEADYSDHYVICFSRKENDERLFDEYIHNESKKGYCLKLSTSMLSKYFDDTYDNDGVFEIKRVLYGTDIQKRIESYITDIIGVTGLSRENLKKYVKPLITNLLMELAFCSKEESYRHEDEIRIVFRKKPACERRESETCNELNGYQYIDTDNPCIIAISKNSKVSENEDQEIRKSLCALGHSYLFL